MGSSSNRVKSDNIISICCFWLVVSESGQVDHVPATLNYTVYRSMICIGNFQFRQYLQKQISLLKIHVEKVNLNHLPIAIYASITIFTIWPTLFLVCWHVILMKVSVILFSWYQTTINQSIIRSITYLLFNFVM